MSSEAASWTARAGTTQKLSLRADVSVYVCKGPSDACDEDVNLPLGLEKYTDSAIGVCSERWCVCLLPPCHVDAFRFAVMYINQKVANLLSKNDKD